MSFFKPVPAIAGQRAVHRHCERSEAIAEAGSRKQSGKKQTEKGQASRLALSLH
jgi:hypothetical protein